MGDRGYRNQSVQRLILGEVLHPAGDPHCFRRQVGEFVDADLGRGRHPARCDVEGGECRRVRLSRPVEQLRLHAVDSGERQSRVPHRVRGAADPRGNGNRGRRFERRHGRHAVRGFDGQAHRGRAVEAAGVGYRGGDRHIGVGNVGGLIGRSLYREYARQVGK